MPLIFLPPTLTLELDDLPNLCDLDPVRDLKPLDLQDASHDAGSSELGLDERHTLAGAGPMTSASFICLFNRPRY